MIAIFKREFKSYFTTPIGYIVLTIFFFFLGMNFTDYYSIGMPDVTAVMYGSVMLIVIIIALPILTMRLMSEDKRQKVDQVLFTAPVSLTSVILGKFLASFAIFAISFSPTVIFEIIFASKVDVNVFYYLYALLGIFLLGGAIIAIGLFFSCLTESAAVAAMFTIVVNVISVVVVDSIITKITMPDGTGFFDKIARWILTGIVALLEQLNFVNRASGFVSYVFRVEDIIYFLSVITIFLFLSVRTLERRRWS